MKVNGIGDGNGMCLGVFDGAAHAARGLADEGKAPSTLHRDGC